MAVSNGLLSKGLTQAITTMIQKSDDIIKAYNAAVTAAALPASATPLQKYNVQKPIVTGADYTTARKYISC